MQKKLWYEKAMRSNRILTVYLLSLVALILAPAISEAQVDGVVHAKSFPGVDVATKTTNALAACPTFNTVPCYVLLDPSLASFPSGGSLPTPGTNQFIVDFRTQWPGNGSLNAIYWDGIIQNNTPSTTNNVCVAVNTTSCTWQPISFANVAYTNVANNFTTGPQTLNTPNRSGIGLIVQGTPAGTSTPTVGGSIIFTFSPNVCNATLAASAGDIFLVSTSQVGGTVQPPTVDSVGSTFSLVQSGGNLNIWKSVPLTAGSHAINVSNFCNGGDVIDISGNGGTPSVDTLVDAVYTNNPNPSTVGPLTTSVSNDLLIEFTDHTNCAIGTGNYPTPTGGAGYTLLVQNSGNVFNQAFSSPAATVGNYSASTVPPSACVGGGPTTTYYLVAVKGGTIHQSGDLADFLADDHATIDAGFDANGNYYNNSSTCSTSLGGFWNAHDKQCETPAGTPSKDQNFSVTGCSLSNSTDNQCTGSFALPVAYADSGYTIECTAESTASPTPNVFMTVSGLSASTVNYAETCTFSCSAVASVNPILMCHTNHP